MNGGTKFLLILALYSMLLFVTAVLFVILYFRVFPEQFLLAFPAAAGFGLITGLLSYLPLKFILEKK